MLAVADAAARHRLLGFFNARDDEVEPVSAARLTEELAARTDRAGPAELPEIIVLQIDESARELAELRQRFPAIPILVVAVPSAESAFQAAKLGASEMLTLPLSEVQIELKLGGMIESLVSARSHNGSSPPFSTVFSSSPRMSEIKETVERVATTSATVLIRGESGVGKELIARAIFARSERRQRPFVKVNCAAIPHELLESELFGFEAGAFTGAQRAKPGKFELANHGTLFLDEIAEMHPALQAKLLHVLQDGEFARLGAKRDTAVDVRVLCATNQMLEQRVAEGQFREDLFYRINVVTIHVPPLRERRDEIPDLLKWFIEKYSNVYRRKVPPLGPETMDLLLAYSWPGNIRELENICKRYVIVGNSAQIVREIKPRVEASKAVPPESASPAPAVTKELSLLEIGRRAARAAETQAIRETLIETRWNRKEAARRLQVSYKAFLNKLRVIEEEDGSLLWN